MGNEMWVQDLRPGMDICEYRDKRAIKIRVHKVEVINYKGTPGHVHINNQMCYDYDATVEVW